MRKILFTIALSIMLLKANAQSWTTCGSEAGTFNGSYTNVLATQSIVLPGFSISPSPTIFFPNTEYLIVLHDSLATDSLGNVIIQTSVDGNVSPNDLGLMISDTFSVVPFSYKLLDYKKMVHSILNDGSFLLGPCCNIVEQNTSTMATCSSLNANGITDSSDVNTLTDVIKLLSILHYGEERNMSLRALNDALSGLNSGLNLLHLTGCSGGVSEFCYAFDSLHSNHANYIVSPVCVNTSSTINVSSCDSYISPSGNYLWSTSNIYQDTIRNAKNCDSIITINLTIDAIDITISSTDNTLSANENGATYQWFDCAGMTAIPDENNKNFIATSSGNYAVEVTKNSCSKTSNCIDVTLVGIAKTTKESGINIYPNPTSSIINTEEGQLEILDLSGNIVLSTVSNGQVDVSGLETGIYFVTQNGKKAKLIIE